MVEQHVTPIDDVVPHSQTPLCLCKPRRVYRDAIQVVYWHPSFDHREFWMAIEQMLGLRCKKHHRYIDEQGEHRNIEPLYEYDHERVDPDNT